jgi:hypothetical protein
MGIAGVMLFCGPASAQFVDIFSEPGPELCDEPILVGHQVSGGCPFEFRSTEHILVTVYMPLPIVRDSCNMHLETRIGGEHGLGYVTQAVLSDEDPPATPPCTLQPCDELVDGQHTFVPWPLEIVENGPGDEGLTLHSCLIGTSAPEGHPGTHCTLHLDFSEIASHEFEFGGDPSEEFCDAPYTFISLRDAHFEYEEGSPMLEVIH